MVSENAHKFVLSKPVDAGDRIRTVADDVPDRDEVIGSLIFRGDQNRLEGFEVGVYVC